MQITIVQAEIELAIINFMKSQVVIRDDQEVTVDLRATRGAEGYQAVIDIRPKADAEPGNSEPTLTPAPSALKPLGIEKAVEAAKAEPEVEAPAKTETKPKSAAKTIREPVAKEEIEIQPVPEIAKEVAEVIAEAQADVENVTGLPVADEPAAEDKPARVPLFNKPKAVAATPVAEVIGGATDEPTSAPVSIFGSLKKPVNQ